MRIEGRNGATLELERHDDGALTVKADRPGHTGVSCTIEQDQRPELGSMVVSGGQDVTIQIALKRDLVAGMHIGPLVGVIVDQVVNQLEQVRGSL